MIDRIIRLMQAAWTLETESLAGRTNLVGMVLALLASGLVSSLSIFEAVVRVFQPEYHSTLPALQMFIVYLLFNAACVALIAALER